MARIALVVPVWVGHLNPMTTLGRELHRRGHEVLVCSFPEGAARIARAGLKHAVIGERTFPIGEWERRTRELSVLHGFAAARSTVRWLNDVSRVMLEELPSVLTRERAGGLVMDQVCFGAECAAEEAGLPLVVACNALPVHLQPDVPLHTLAWPYRAGLLPRLGNRALQSLLLLLARPSMAEIRRRRCSRGESWNARQYLNEIPPSLAQVAQLPACLDFPRAHAPDHFHHTGPWHEPNLVGETSVLPAVVDDRPLIYASLGTLQNGLDYLYQAILDACAELPVRLVLALGRENGSVPARVPANATVLGYAPQLALLRRASLVITHAGLNTTLEALTHGLPLVALPIANDQPGVAARIRHAGVGDWLASQGLSPTRLQAMVQQVLSQSSYRSRARQCADSIGRARGLTRAAEIVEEAVMGGRRILRGKV